MQELGLPHDAISCNPTYDIWSWEQNLHRKPMLGWVLDSREAVKQLIDYTYYLSSPLVLTGGSMDGASLYICYQA